MAAFDPEDITAEFLIGGTWYDTYAGVELAPRIRGADAIRITRGYVDQQSSFSATNGTFTLNNRDGLFSPGNALSPLYGKIKQNLPVRLGVKDAAGTWDEYLRVPDFDAFTVGQYMSTADKASLDITGDIDIRIEFTPAYTRVRRQNLAGKYVVAGTDRSWHLEIRSDGQMSLLTSPDGTFASALTNLSGVSLAEDCGRIAIRVTLDVNNGAAGRVYTWYSATSIAGPWTQIAAATVAGTTSIQATTAALEVGSASLGAGPFSTSRVMAGKIHAFELYDGIAGTLVADFKPQGRGVGQVAAWADTCASPNTWTMTGDNIRLASDRIRLNAELSSLPEMWDVTGKDRFVRTTAASMAKRYVSNKSALNSAIYRLYRNRAGVVAYWPMEDQAGATQASNVVDAPKPGHLVQCVFGSTTGLDGSAGALTLSSAPNISKATLYARLPVTATGASSILFYFKLDSLPATDQTFLTLNLAPGVMTRWEFRVGAATYRFIGFDNVGAEIYNSGAVGFGTGANPVDQWTGMQLSFAQEGGNVRFQTSWHAVGTDIFYTHFVGGTTTAGTLGKGIGRALFGTPDAAFAGAQIAHVMVATVSDLSLVSGTFAEVSQGYNGETAGRRMLRLAEEEGEYFEWVGDLDLTEIVGPQPPDKFVNLMSSAARVDGGLFGDIRDTRGWRYVTRAALGNRRGLTLDYSASHLDATPTPVTDDRYLVNDFTATRPAGSSARYEANDGRPLSVNDPDDSILPGAGRYEQSGAFNASTDDQLYRLASAQVSAGTQDKARIPNLSVALHRDEVNADGTLTDEVAVAVIGADFGDPATLTGLADAPMSPDDVLMSAFGYTETIGQAGQWGWVANTVPAGPYQVPILGVDDVNGEPRMDADFPDPDTGNGHVQVHGAYASAATSIILRTDQDNSAKQVIDSTTYSAEFPCDWSLAGEQVTMTACTAPSSSAALLQGTFESADGGVSGWDVSGGSIAASAVFADTGTQSALLTVSGSPTVAFIRTGSAGAAPVTPGKSYTLTLRVRSVALLADVRAFINWYNAAGAQISTPTSGAAALASGAWTTRTVTATAPDGAVSARYGSLAQSSPANGSLLYTDTVTFTSTGYVYQTATLTRAVNGIAKAQADGEQVHLWETFDLGMN